MNDDISVWVWIAISFAVGLVGFALLRGVFRRLRDMVEKPAKDPGNEKLEPECTFVVTIEGDEVCHFRPDGTEESFLWSDLEKIHVLTTDDGPWAPDVFWVFHASGDTGAVIPQGATGEKELLDKMLAQPGFNSEKFTGAMSSTSNAVFEVWEKPEEESAG